MFLILGLGNPEKAYAGHRHNVGFMTADAIHARHGFGEWAGRHHGMLAKGRIGAQEALLLKPMTFMNRSGIAAGEVARFYKISLERIFAFHDELDLAFGKVRVKRGGGNAGHNGLKSLDAHLGADYWRVRIGIGHPGTKERVTGHVLGDFTAEERAEMERILKGIAAHAALLMDGAPERFMSEVARERSA